METKIKNLLINSEDPIAEIVQIINTEKAKTSAWQTALAFFVVVFIGWYCIHGQVNHGNNKQESCAEKDSIIRYKDIVIGIQAQCLDSAIYFTNIK